MNTLFETRKNTIKVAHEELLSRKNEEQFSINGIYSRYKYPVLTREHAPLHWRFDFNPETNPFFIERIGINATFNSGAIMWNGKYLVVVRVEGNDRKSFFAIAESPNGVDDFRFWERPITIPQTDNWETNVYDMRLTAHEDGWIYGVFCAERKDPNAPDGDTSSATATAGIVRTKDLLSWERLPDLISHGGQQRNVVLFEKFVDGKYAFGWGLSGTIENAEVPEENIIDPKTYHTVYEVKNGMGPHPIKTDKGWLHLAHGVRNTAAGLRYVLYVCMADANDVSKITHKPHGHFIAPLCDERVGDVSNVVFSNGWIADEDGTVFIYYASSDTRLHVAKTSIDQLVDYCLNTPSDKLYSHLSVQTINELIDNNKKFI